MGRILFCSEDWKKLWAFLSLPSFHPLALSSFALVGFARVVCPVVGSVIQIVLEMASRRFLLAAAVRRSPTGTLKL